MLDTRFHRLLKVIQKYFFAVGKNQIVFMIKVGRYASEVFSHKEYLSKSTFIIQSLICCMKLLFFSDPYKNLPNSPLLLS